MGILSLLLAAALGLAGPGSTSGGRRDEPRPGARGNDTATEILGHSAQGLVRIDLSTGQPQVTPIGAFGAQITDIAQMADGRLFGVSFSALFTIDLQTGRAQLVGPLGVSNINGLAASGRRLVAGSTDGVFYDVDASTGRATPIGRFGGGVVSSGDLAFSPAGVLYMTSPVGRQRAVDRLVRVDPSTGHATIIGSTGLAHVYGLAFVGDDLVGLTESGAVVRIDTRNGAAAPLGQTQIPFWGGA